MALSGQDIELIGRLWAALWNLLDNAAKYSAGCAAIWVDLAPEGARVAVRVGDQGPGIRAIDQKEIFKKIVRGAARLGGDAVADAFLHHPVPETPGRISRRAPGRARTPSLAYPV